MDTLYQKIAEAKKAESGYHYAVLDFDNTCIINDIGEATLNFLCEKSLLKNMNLLEQSYSNTVEYHKAVLKYYYTILETGDIEKAYSLTAQCISGFQTHEIKNIVERVIKHEGTTIARKKIFGIEINKGLVKRKGVADIMNHATKENIDVYIVSASPQCIVGVAFSLFYPTVQATIIGIKSEIEHSTITEKLCYPLSTKEGKVFHIKNKTKTHIKPIFVIGDSMNDFSMLNYAQVPVIVDRDNELSAHARKQGWFLVAGK